MSACDEDLHGHHGKIEMEQKKVDKNQQSVDLIKELEEGLNYGLVADTGITSWDIPSNHLHIKAPKQLRKR